jgi:hypothetical protein
METCSRCHGDFKKTVPTEEQRLAVLAFLKCL